MGKEIHSDLKDAHNTLLLSVSYKPTECEWAWAKAFCWTVTKIMFIRCLYLLQQVGGRQCDKGPWEQWPVQFPQQSTHFPHSEVKRRHEFNMTYRFLVCIEPWLKYATEQVYCMFEQFRFVGEALHSKEIYCISGGWRYKIRWKHIVQCVT